MKLLISRLRIRRRTLEDGPSVHVSAVESEVRAVNYELVNIQKKGICDFTDSGKLMLEEIKELRLLDTANEEIEALLHNVKYVLLNIPGGC